MNRILCLIFCAAVLQACASSPSSVRITHDEPAAAEPRALAVTKSEMVFYNGKTYNVDMAPTSGGATVVTVSGMAATQAKDANGLSMSAFHHFTCKDSQKAKVITKPAYSDSRWSLTLRCG